MKPVTDRQVIAYIASLILTGFLGAGLAILAGLPIIEVYGWPSAPLALLAAFGIGNLVVDLHLWVWRGFRARLRAETDEFDARVEARRAARKEANQ